jgi:regulatory protein
MKITSIKQQIERPWRVSVLVDDKFFCGLTLDQVLEFSLKKDVELTEELAANLKAAAKKSLVMERVMKLIYARPRTIYEVKTYLKQKEVGPLESQSIIDYLVDKEYLDDMKFAKWRIENSLSSSKPRSELWLKQDLTKKGIPREIISEVLSEQDFVSSDTIAITKLLEKRRRQRPTEPAFKTSAWLIGKGYSWEVVKELVAGERGEIM